MTRKIALIASTALALSAAPLLAEDAPIAFDPTNTLAGQEDRVSTISAINGGDVVTSDGVVLGQIEDFSFNENDRAVVQIDVEADLRYDGDTMLLMIDPEHVSVAEGSIALEPTDDELFAAVEPAAGRIEIDFK
ncbi:PRC-barrel domain-containing protein [Tateyamaria sp. syn59]|uniref:PRC-barrel domain-containing protein n=1 Tax=Tateyamaria sp. syn59 TaxID=2576942 RepID=UPI0011BF3383|nr:PRC-barrel domain-containing protein [Tateyamaria sp. syn59]